MQLELRIRVCKILKDARRRQRSAILKPESIGLSSHKVGASGTFGSGSS